MGLWEICIVIALVTIPKYHYEKHKPQLTYLYIPDHGMDSILVSPTQNYKSNYFCPKYCEVDHYHLAHINTYKCGPKCDHVVYIENWVEPGEEYVSN